MRPSRVLSGWSFRPLALGAAAAALALALSACGGGNDDGGGGADIRTRPLLQAPIPSELEGTYEMTVNNDQATAALRPGRWTLSLVDQTYVIGDPQGELLAGSVQAAEGGDLSFTASPECREESPGPGRYSLNRTDGTLTFININEPCNDRGAMLSTNPWRRVRPTG